MSNKEPCLNKEQILKLIRKNNLIAGYINLDIQLTPNGFDLTAGEIFEFACAGHYCISYPQVQE